MVLFVPDQWRGDVLGHAGNPAAQTPVLDGLVSRDAVSFTQAFCQNPVCVPSRCSFMTGLYPHNRGHRTMFHMLHPELGERHLLQVLREQGYFVWWGGRNDLFDAPSTDDGSSEVDIRFKPTEEQIRRWGGSLKANPHLDLNWRPAPGEPGYYSFYRGRLPSGDGEIYLDSDWADVLGAVEFLQNFEGDQPLCLILDLIFPHPPYECEEPFYSAINRDVLPERIPTPDEDEGKPRILGAIRERQSLGDWEEEKWRELRATYYGACMRVDHQLGRVVDALQKREMYDDTALFFFSDHGDFTGDYGLVEKNYNTFEDCLTRVPLIIKPPRGTPVVPGLRSALVELIDVPATIYDLINVDPGYDHFGRSLLEAIGGSEEHRDAVFCEGGRRPGEKQASEWGSTSSLVPTGLYWPRVGLQVMEDPFYHTQGVMCRTGRWKYVRREGELDELYDLEKDPAELENRILDPELASLLADMRERTLAWFHQTTDPVPRREDVR